MMLPVYDDSLLMLQNCSVGIVGKDMPFTIYDDDPVNHYVSFITYYITDVDTVIHNNQLGDILYICLVEFKQKFLSTKLLQLCIIEF